ncbi:MAG: hypothetical protein LBU81_06360 [Methanosarcinales archaeon]|nr:hypothetical protein [Methanosarcinales archaeon]
MDDRFEDAGLPEFSPADIPDDIRQSVNNADFADIMLEKRRFAEVLSPEGQKILRFVEKNVALANFSDLDVKVFLLQLDNIIDSETMKYPPAFLSWTKQQENEMLLAIGRCEATRAKNATERRLLATQLTESTINQNSIREGTESTGFLSRIARGFMRR